MLRELVEMPDEAKVWTLVATRHLTEQEQTAVHDLVDAWLEEWSEGVPQCPVSASQVILGGHVFAWAMDLRPLHQYGLEDHLTGGDLDPLYRALEQFAAGREPPVEIVLNDALIIDGEVVPLGPAWLDLGRAGRITAETPILHHGSTAADWRAGRLVPRLGDSPEWISELRSKGLL
jgi:hypothetical protein